MGYVLESKCLFMFVGILLQRKVNTCILFLDDDFTIDEEQDSKSN
jgi:hypothetical protein